MSYREINTHEDFVKTQTNEFRSIMAKMVPQNEPRANPGDNSCAEASTKPREKDELFGRILQSRE